MAPSRGNAKTLNLENQDETAVNQQSNSALLNARRNFRFLLDPSSSNRPNRLRTRAFLRTIRYISQFIVWRLVRWAKYAAIGALVAAVGATAFGSLMSGIGWVLAPPSIGASVAAMGIWSAGKFAARRFNKQWRSTGMDAGEERREYESDNPAIQPGVLGSDVGPQSVPW